MRQISGLDGIFLHSEMSDSPAHIGSLGIYDPSTAKDGFVRFKDILRTFETRLNRSHVFTNKLKGLPFNIDHPYWVEDSKFDLEYHVRHLALPKPGDWRQLCIQVSRLHSQALDFRRPLWMAYVIEGVDAIEGVPEGSFAIYMKFHHVAVDGMAGNDFATSLHDLEPIPVTGEYGDNLKHRKVSDEPSQLNLLGRAYVNSLARPSKVADLAMNVVPGLLRRRQFRQTHEMDEITRPQTRFNGTVSPHRVFDGIEIPFEKIKEIRKSVPGVTINDVALTIFSQAIRGYLKEKGELPDTSLSALVPVSLRSQDQAASGGNEITNINVSLHTEIEDPLEALKTISDKVKVVKEQRQEAGEEALIQVINTLPSTMQAGFAQINKLTTRFGAGMMPANTTVTNVPGPQFPIYMAGAKAVKIQGIGFLQHGVGLFNVVSSYMGNMTLSFIACRDRMPDPETYKAHILASFERLYESVQIKEVPKKKTTTKRVSSTKPASAAKAANSA